VPWDIDNATPAINVTVDGQTQTSNTLFHLNAPVIDSISPKTAIVGQEIRINGKGFAMTGQVYLNNSQVSSYNGVPTSVIYDTRNAAPGSYSFGVGFLGLKTLAKDSLTLIAQTPPDITSIDGDTVLEGDQILITGHHFLFPDPSVSTTVSTVDNGNVVYFSLLTSPTDNSIIATVPRLSNNLGQYKITVTVLSSSVTYATPFVYEQFP
jgi:hypothetical protein